MKTTTRFTLLLATLITAPLVGACASDEASLGRVDANLARHACNVAGLTDAQIRECIQWVTDQTDDPAWCEGVYDCTEYANTYCEGADNYGIACAEVGVACSGTPNTGHHANVVFFPGSGCYAVEPQNGTVIAGPWAPVNGSCNTFTEDIADRICASGNGGEALCAVYDRDGGIADWIPCDFSNPQYPAASPAPAPAP